MKITKYSLTAVDHQIEIIPIADCHIGSPNFNESLLNEVLDYIYNKDNAYCVLVGDIMDGGLKNSLSNVYKNDMSPSVALSYATMKFKPLADKGKILCIVGGNHDADRFNKETDISQAMQFAVQLGLGERYSDDSYCLCLSVEKGCANYYNKNILYKIFVSHGRNGSGTTTGAKTNALAKMANSVVNADVYIHAHTHFPVAFKDEYREIEEKTASIMKRERLFVNCNSFLHWENSYGEAKLYQPTSQSIPKIVFTTIRSQANRMNHFIKKIHCEI